MAHRLDCLVNPASIAVVGASRRAGSVGNGVMRNLLAGGYTGRLFAVNPRYQAIEGIPCFPALAALPESVEQVIFAVGDERVESLVDEAIACGAKSGVIFSSLILREDSDPPLVARVRAKVRRAGLLLCGGNGMGYYNFRDRVWACGFETRAHRPGGVTLISQSGSGMSAILDVEERLDFNFAVSTGQELSVTMEDYLDYALEQPETKAVGLFLETCREPEAFTAALAKAWARRIPIVVVKVGRTELAARLTPSHSGALAGSDAVFDSVFRRYGVQRVADLDELATTLILFAQPHPPARGGLVAIHDSGGERQLLIDLAEEMDVPLAELAPETVSALAGLLDPGLPPVNPLDAWGRGGPRYHEVMEQCFTALLSDPAAAMGAVVHARAPGGGIYPAYVEYLRKAHAATGKPAFLVAARQGAGSDPAVLSVTREGFPVLDGVRPFLAGARSLLAHRDFLSRPPPQVPHLEPGLRSKWLARLGSPELNEAEALSFLGECGIPAVQCAVVRSESELRSVMRGFRFPVVLKTAAHGIAHKSEAGGVILDLRGEAELIAAYRGLAARHGPVVTLARMVDEPGVEMIMGMHTDPQFGPVVVLGAGGVHAEVLRDAVTVMPPFDAEEAQCLLASLRLRPLLDGARGGPPVDVAAFCRAAASFSARVTAFAEVIREIDVNPVKVLREGCVALDALIVSGNAGAPRATEPALACRGKNLNN